MRKRTVHRRTSKAHKKPSKKFKVFWKKGTITLYVLLIVIIAGAFFLAGGFPKFEPSPTVNQSAGEVVIESPDPQRNNLQLKTLKFKNCESTVAVDFLVDTSGSMRDNNKLQNIEAALKSFAGNFTDKSITGIRRFSSNDDYYCPAHPATSRLTPIDFYANNKVSFAQESSNLCADGGTNTRVAFAEELKDLTAAVQKVEYKDNPFNLVFISDGIPEGQAFPAGGDCSQFVNSRFPMCAPYQNGSQNICRCFDSDQDPTTNPQIAQQVQALKNINGKNVRVFSVLVFDPASDGPFEDRLTTMMTNIASPGDFHKTTDPTEIKNIFSEISSKICSSQSN